MTYLGKEFSLVDVKVSAANTAGLDLDLSIQPLRISYPALLGHGGTARTIPRHHYHAVRGAEPRRCHKPQASHIYRKVQSQLWLQYGHTISSACLRTGWDLGRARILTTSDWSPMDSSADSVVIQEHILKSISMIGKDRVQDTKSLNFFSFFSQPITNQHQDPRTTDRAGQFAAKREDQTYLRAFMVLGKLPAVPAIVLDSNIKKQ